VKEEAEKQGIICTSAMNGDGLEEFCNAIQKKLKVCFFSFEANDLFIHFFPRCYGEQFKWNMGICLLQDSLVPIEAFVPYDKGDLLNDIHKVGIVEKTVSILCD
jgi:GTPase